MAAYVNRSVSMMAGDGPHNVTALNNGSVRVNANNTDSPLQIFVRAKKKINDIFVEIDDYVKDAVSFMQEVAKGDLGVATAADVAHVESYISKVEAIREVLKRDHMKVAFFGRTSNGKSTVINAMLHDKILPSGIGHTTNCFLQVQGSDTSDAYLQTEGSDERLSVQSVGQLGHALHARRLQESELVHVYWPRTRCTLLRDDVALVDSPGVDVTPDTDTWIDKYCLDADVFVLVANAESTLMVTEKNFFHKVSMKISQPNIFILNNRWDASASEPDYMEQVRSQHATRCAEFLSKELGVCSAREADERIFFISAKEALLTRLNDRDQPDHGVQLAEGHQVRYFEFLDFERKFSECISQSAVRTKFAGHARRGRAIAAEVGAALDAAVGRAAERHQGAAAERAQLEAELAAAEAQLTAATREMKDKIARMVESVEHKVSLTLSQEIRRLSALVEAFRSATPFSRERPALEQYKQALHRHVESGLGQRLKQRLSADIGADMARAQREMSERMFGILGGARRAAAQHYMAPLQQPFEVLYRLNCDNLCADFQEDLSFRFSYGLAALLARCQGRPAPYKRRPELYGPDAPPVSGAGAGAGLLSGEQWALVSRGALAALGGGGGQGAAGALLLGGLVLRAVGWRALALAGAAYGALYAWERATWTAAAQERELKRQYVAHAGRKLRLVVDLTGANCSHQVQQELATLFARLCRLVDEATTEMDGALGSLRHQLARLDAAAAGAKRLRNRAAYLAHELQLFAAAYLEQRDH